MLAKASEKASYTSRKIYLKYGLGKMWSPWERRHLCTFPLPSPPLTSPSVNMWNDSFTQL